MNSNMYYAMNKSNEPCFKVSRKKLSKKAKLAAKCKSPPSRMQSASFSFQVSNEVAGEATPEIALQSYSSL